MSNKKTVGQDIDSGIEALEGMYEDGLELASSAYDGSVEYVNGLADDSLVLASKGSNLIADGLECMATWFR